MDADKKALYKDRMSKTKIVDNKPRETYASDGTPLSFLENQQKELEKHHRKMKLEIKETVESCRNSFGILFIRLNNFSV